MCAAWLSTSARLSTPSSTRLSTSKHSAKLSSYTMWHCILRCVETKVPTQSQLPLCALSCHCVPSAAIVCAQLSVCAHSCHCVRTAAIVCAQLPLCAHSCHCVPTSVILCPCIASLARRCHCVPTAAIVPMHFNFSLGTQVCGVGERDRGATRSWGAAGRGGGPHT